MTTDNIEKLAILVKTDDGKTRHLITKKENKRAILQMIAAVEGEIVITEQPAEGIIFKEEE